MRGIITSKLNDFLPNVLHVLIQEKPEGSQFPGNTESWFYLRARAIADGKPDPMSNV